MVLIVGFVYFVLLVSHIVTCIIPKHPVFYYQWIGRPENCFQKWASALGPLFCVRTDVAAEGAETQNFGPEKFFHHSPTYV